MGRRLVYLIPLVAAGAALYAIVASGGDEPEIVAGTVESPPLCTQHNPLDQVPAEVPRPPKAPPSGKLRAIVRTNCGRFEIALDSERFPRTVASFVHLAQHGVYENTGFHRIVPGTLIEGGDPLANGSGGPGYAVVERPPPGIRYPRKSVVMANPRADLPGMSGSQFFIVLDRGITLDARYARLGRVIAGFNTIREIEGLADPAAAGEEPVQPVSISRVRITQD